MMLAQSALRKLVQSMQQLSGTEMEELFRIIERAKCPYTCNNHGVFINLSWVPESVIQDIEKFIAYCDHCRQELDKYDQMLSLVSGSREDHELNAKAATVRGAARAGPGAGVGSVSKATTEEELKNRKSRGTNYNIKFYLLKKRLQKNNNLYHEWEDTLTCESYAD